MTKEKLMALRAKYEAALAGPSAEELAVVEEKVAQLRASLMAELDAKYAEVAKVAALRIPFIDELIALEEMEPELPVEEPAPVEVAPEEIPCEYIETPEEPVIDNAMSVEEVQEVEEPVIEERHGLQL